MPALSLSNAVPILVENVSILVDLLAFELLSITLYDLTDNPTFEDNVALSIDDTVGEVFEW